MASVLDSTDEKSNGFKLMRLIIDGGTEALRNQFKTIYPGNLQVVLSCHRLILSSLKTKRIITPHQWDQLYPTTGNPPNLGDFDITLLCILLRNICGLPPPSLGWDKMPSVRDLSIQADIVRIRLFRNERFAHISDTAISAAEYENFWADISSPLVRLGVNQMRGGS